MRVATLASVWPPTLIHSHRLSSTFINFELVQILMRVNKSLCAFDRSWELMRVAKVLAVCCKNLFKLLVVHSLQLWVSSILSSSIIFVCWPTHPASSHQLSSSFDRSIWELTKLSCELSLLNSHQLSSSFDRAFLQWCCILEGIVMLSSFWIWPYGNLVSWSRKE